MRFLKIMSLYLVLLLAATGCRGGAAAAGPKREAVVYSEKTYTLDAPLELDFTCDFGNVEVYSRDKEEMKFEITRKVRGTQAKEVLEKKLEDFHISVKKEGARVGFKAAYTGSIKEVGDKSADIRLYIPKKVKSMAYKLETGTLKFYDDVKGDLTADLKRVNIEVNKVDGNINIKGDRGNVRISDGRLRGDCSISENVGSISVKGGLEENHTYSFHTNMGNIELQLPAASRVTLECAGNVEVNQFSFYNSRTKAYLKSGMGKITVKKY